MLIWRSSLDQDRPLSVQISHENVVSGRSEFMDPYPTWNVYFDFGKSDELAIIDFQPKNIN